MLLLQLAGDLWGKTLREWEKESKSTYIQAVASLHTHLDPGSRILAAQDFHHTSQKSDENVADFIHRLEHTFQIAYGRDKMSTETRETLLFGQLQDGLRHNIMQVPAVSEAHNYQELCLATCIEEKRQLELVKRRQYGQQSKPTSSQTHLPNIRCHGCGKFGHIQAN